MFEDTLLIIKADYMYKRKPLLTYLLGRGFQILGHRKVYFTPELAAEFYKDKTDEPNFMRYVIMLSKGNSEAFILSKENAVQNLLNTMVCYFGTSVDMERHIHVTQCARKVHYEITYIFPNYIHEPIYCPEQLKFCTDNPVIKPLFGELYNIIKNKEVDPHKNWKRKLAEFFERSNPSVPHISFGCIHKPKSNVRDQEVQTTESSFKYRGEQRVYSCSTLSVMSFTTAGTSVNVTSSSCVSCSKFGSGDQCIQQTKRPPISLVDLVKAKTAPLVISSPSISEKSVEEEDLFKQEKAWFKKDGNIIMEEEEAKIMSKEQSEVSIQIDELKVEPDGDKATVEDDTGGVVSEVANLEETEQQELKAPEADNGAGTVKSETIAENEPAKSTQIEENEPNKESETTTVPQEQEIKEDTVTEPPPAPTTEGEG